MLNHIQQHLRFKANPLDIAQVDLTANTPQFMPEMAAMIVDESFSGAALIMKATDDLVVGSYLRVKVGRMDALRAEVVWMKRLDRDVIKVGVNFLE